jgi:hypothetical protein
MPVMSVSKYWTEWKVEPEQNLKRLCDSTKLPSNIVLLLRSRLRR